MFIRPLPLSPFQAGKTGYITRKLKKSQKWKAMFFVFSVEKQRLFAYDTACVGGVCSVATCLDPFPPFRSAHSEAVKPKSIIDVPSCSLHVIDDSFFGR